MLGLDMLDVAIGLALVYFVFSLAVTAAKEALEAGLKYRARDLEKGIRELLDDPDGSKLAAAFYDHPLIYSLYRGGSGGAKRVLPSYIPARNFALAVADLVNGPGKAPDHQKPTDRVVRAVEIAIKAGGDDPDRVRAELEAWYDSAMDRVSGWYKRRTQIIVLLLALVMSVAANIDTIAIFRTLQVDQDLRKVLVKKAEEQVSSDTAAARSGVAPPPVAATGEAPSTAPGVTATAPSGAPSAGANAAGATQPEGGKTRKLAIDELRDTALPIGWSAEQQASFAGKLRDPLALVEVLVGWLLTAFAVMLGSPFWFDVLNRLMVIRSTVKPHEKSPEEASEDKQRPAKKGDTASAPSPPAVVYLLPQAPAGTVPSMVGAVRSTVADGVGTTDASIATASVEDEADEHEDGCLCDHAIDAKDETVDHDLPPATGGVAAAR